MEEPTPFPKVVLLLLRSGSSTTFGLISSANKPVPFPGARLKIIPGKNDKDSKDKEFLWEIEIFTCEKGCIIFLGDSTERFWKVTPLRRSVVKKKETGRGLKSSLDLNERFIYDY